MGIIVDVMVVLILLGSIYLGYKKGIVDVLFKLVAVIISLVVCFVFYRPITNFVVDNTDFDEKIEQIIIEKGVINAEKTSDQASSIDTYVQNYAKEMAQGTQNTIVESSARPIAVNIVGIGVMLILFITIRLGLMIIKSFTNIVAKLPIIKECNEIIGLAYGVLRGALIIYSILAIIYFITPMIGTTEINTAIDNSFITKFLYNNNVIMMFFGTGQKNIT